LFLVSARQKHTHQSGLFKDVSNQSGLTFLATMYLNTTWHNTTTLGKRAARN